MNVKEKKIFSTNINIILLKKYIQRRQFIPVEGTSIFLLNSKKNFSLLECDT